MIHNLKEIKGKNGKNLPKPPSGREWTPEEKEKYYQNFSKDWTSWKNEALKLLATKKNVELNQHRETATSLREIEDYLFKSFNDDLTPLEAVDSY